MFQLFDGVTVPVTFNEDRTQSKTGPAIVLQVDGELVQLIWATTQSVCASGSKPWEFCITDPAEMRQMGHTKAARYDFRRGGVIVVNKSEILDTIGKCPKSVQGRLVRAARNA